MFQSRRLLRQRTAKANQIRGLLTGYGLVVGKQVVALRRALPGLPEDAGNGLSFDFRAFLEDLRQDLIRLDKRVAEMDKKVHGLAHSEAAAIRLQGIPGIGPVIATALLCAAGDGKRFKRGRDMAAWLGLTPRRHGSGGKDRLPGMGMRGDTYLRALLIQGAKSALNVAGNKTGPRSLWLKALCCRRHKNMAVVALANKNARMAWALLRNGTDYLPEGRPA